MTVPTLRTRRSITWGIGAAALVLLSANGGWAAQSDDPATSSGARATVTMQLNAPVDRVFPLFYPVNKSKWDSEWAIEIIGQKHDGRVEAGMVFKRPSDPHRTWTLVNFDLDTHHIEYSYTRANTYDMVVQIQCQDNPHGSTTATVTCTATGHSEQVSESLRHHL